MVIYSNLPQLTAKQLGQLAKQRGIPGWYNMRKAELLESLQTPTYSSTGVFPDSVSNGGSFSGSSCSSSVAGVQSDKDSMPVLSRNGSRRNQKLKPDGLGSSGGLGGALTGVLPGLSSGRHKERIQRISPKPVLDSGNTAGSGNRVTRASRQTAIARKGLSGPLSSSNVVRSVASPRLKFIDLNNSRNSGVQGQSALPDGKSGRKTGSKTEQDRLIVLVRDAFWLHISWEIRQRTLDRLRASMGSDWHIAKPALRMFKISVHNGLSSRKVVRVVPVEFKARNWFVDIDGKPTSYMFEIGYTTETDKFYTILSSNTVTSPEVSTARGFGDEFPVEDTVEDLERIFSLSGGRIQRDSPCEIRELLEEQFHRRIGLPLTAMTGTPKNMIVPFGDQRFPFNIDAKLLIHGKTLPGAHITVQEYPIIVDEDGEFLMHIEMPDKRQIFPIVASSGDGIQQRTIILSVERNTRIMEPVYCDMEEV